MNPQHENMQTPGATGAKRQSWRSANPRDLLKRIIDRDPDAELDELGNEFWAEVRKNAEMLRTIVVDYWLPNNYRSLVKPREDDQERLAKQQERAAAFKDKVTAKVEEITNEKAKIMLLDMLMPNGKKLRHCTGTYCSQVGGWLSEVGRIVGHGKVGDALSEARLKKFHDGK